MAASARRSPARRTASISAQLSAGLGERFETMRHCAEILFLRRLQPHHARRHPRHPQAAAVRTRRHRRHRGARVASHRRSCRLALQARRSDRRATQSAVLRRHAASSKATCSSTNSRPTASPIRRASHSRARSRWCTTRRSPRSAPRTAIRSRVEVHFRDGSIERETREAPRGSEQSFASPRISSANSASSRRGVMQEEQQDALVDAVLGLDNLPGQPYAYRTVLQTCARNQSLAKWNSASSITSTAAALRCRTITKTASRSPKLMIEPGSTPIIWRSTTDAARHGAVAEHFSRRTGAAHPAAAFRSDGLRGAALSSAAADRGNLHARPDERRPA